VLGAVHFAKMCVATYVSWLVGTELFIVTGEIYTVFREACCRGSQPGVYILCRVGI
jgi:hypothetical protein